MDNEVERTGDIARELIATNKETGMIFGGFAGATATPLIRITDNH